MDIFNQSAVIPYIEKNGKLQILLITSLKKKKWIIPKGIIEDNMTAMDSAKKEALEEAGVTGSVSLESYGEYQQKKWGGICHINVFALRVEKELKKWDEYKQRKRKWFPAEKAVEQIFNPDLQKIIVNFISTGKQRSG
jgi:8-oxo-dGTP pyrophosphatase MutT (NUDIX family)